MENYYLALEEGPIQKTLYPLTGSTMIGRSPDSTIRIQDPVVSRHHARVSCQDGIWAVEDLGSANGIFFDGNRVDKMVLTPGDAFQIGDTTFRFIEQDTRKDSDQLLQTVEILASTMEEQNWLAERGGSNSWQQQLLKAIKEIPFFFCMNELERKRLMDDGILYLFNAGESIIREGDHDRSVFVILAGQVKVFTQEHDNEEFELAVLGPSEFFGEISFLTGKPRSSSVAALESSALIEFTHASMQELVQEHPIIKRTLVEYCQGRLADLEEKRVQNRNPEMPA
jgi:pSer/pThr/pTyr-binding forkhead associated (FHA) protein